jgi:hypothetical protein
VTGGNPSHEVAVLSFKAAWTLEATRRENDQKILAIYAEYALPTPIRHLHLTDFRMKNMMEVLVQCVLHSRMIAYVSETNVQAKWRV